MATTRHGQIGIGVRPYGVFAPKPPAISPKGIGPFTRLTSMGIGGRRLADSSKGIGPFTRLTSMGINGRRVEFVPKTPADTGTRSGGVKKVRTHNKKLTEEEVRGLEAYGKARMGIVDEPEIIEEILEPIEVLEVEESAFIDTSDISDISLLNLLPESIPIELEPFEPTILKDEVDQEEMGLILAIMTAHNA